MSIVIYMNEYGNQAIHTTRKIRGQMKHIYKIRRPLGFLPTSVLFENKEYRVGRIASKKDMKQAIKTGLQLVANGEENINWVLNLSDEVQDAMEAADKENSLDNAEGFLCWKNDIQNPNMTGITFLETPKTYKQMRVSKLAPGIFQVDCYNNSAKNCEMSLIVNLNRPLLTTCEIIYLAKESGYVENNIREKARELVERFRACMIFNRICSWEDVEASQVHDILPLPTFK